MNEIRLELNIDSSFSDTALREMVERILRFEFDRHNVRVPNKRIILQTVLITNHDQTN